MATDALTSDGPMIYKFSVRTCEEHDPALAATRAQLQLSDFQRWRDIYLEIDGPLSSPQVEQICASLANGFTETAALARPLIAGREVQVAYKRGIVDNENDSLVELCRLLGIAATAGKVATTFASPSAHAGPRSLPMSWCTPWKITLRSVPCMLSTPL